jgi:hypothetical protein
MTFMALANAMNVIPEAVLRRLSGIQRFDLWVPGLQRATSCCAAPGMTKVSP